MDPSPHPIPGPQDIPQCSFYGYTGISAQLQAYVFARKHTILSGSAYILDQIGGSAIHQVREAGASLCNDTNLIRIHSGYKGAPPLIMPMIPTNPAYLMRHARTIFVKEFAEADADFTCTICMENLDASGHRHIVKNTLCDHTFHVSCVYAQLDKKLTTCANCRAELRIEEHPILEDIKRGVIVGDAAEPFLAALRKMHRTEIHVKTTGIEMKRSMDTLLAQMGFGDLKRKLPVPDFTKRETYKMNYPRQSKGGLYRGETDSDEHIVYRTNPTKQDCYGPSVTKLISMFERIKRRTGKDPQDYGVEEWEIIISELRTKLEIQLDPDKLRIFFNPEMMKFLFDKVSAYPVYRWMYNRGPILVGFKWANNGASRLFRYLRGVMPGRPQTHIYWEWDISRFDQSVKAAILVLAATIILAFYDEDDPNYPLLRAGLAWSADNYAVKFVHWLLQTEWRAVIGLIFSGEYGTSMIDSLVSALLFIGYVNYVMDTLQEKLSPTEFAQLRPFFDEIMNKVYGDDGIASIPLDLVPYMKLLKENARVLPYELESFQEYAARVWDMVIKPSDSGEYDTLYSTPNDQGGLSLVGPKILQRHFVIRGYVMSDKSTRYRVHGYRTSAKMMVKTFKTVTAVDNKLVQVGRVVGMLWDTQGVNRHAWIALSRHLDMLEDELKNEHDDDDYDPYVHLAELLHNNPYDNITMEMVARLKKSDTSLTLASLSIRPTYDQVSLHFNDPSVEIGEQAPNRLLSWHQLALIGER